MNNLQKVWVDGQGNNLPVDTIEDSHLGNLLTWCENKMTAFNNIREENPRVADFVERQFIGRQGATVEEWRTIFFEEVVRRQDFQKQQEIYAIESQLAELKSREEKVDELKRKLEELKGK